MNSTVPESLTAPVLVYQNKQLARLVRKLRANRNPLSISYESANPPNEDLKRTIDSLTERNAYLESRLLRSRSGGFRDPVGESLSDIQKTDEVFRASGAGMDEQNVELEYLRKECSRLRTSLAITSQQPHLPAQTVRMEQPTAAIPVSMIDCTEFKGDIMDNLENLRISSSARDHGFNEEVRLLTQTISEKDEQIQLIKQQSRVPETQPSGNRQTSDGYDAPSVTTGDQTSQVFRDQLRQKDEQISRMLVQHVTTQSLLAEAEREIEVLRNNQVNSSKLRAITDEWGKLLGEANSHKDSLASNLIRELKKRDEYISLVMKDRELVVRQLLDLQATHASFNDVLRSLQSELDEFRKQATQEARKNRFGSSSATSGALANLELDDLKRKVQCSLCKTREKSVVLTTCMHCYCRECVNEQMLSARNRKCPLCMQRFSDAEVKEVHFLQD